MSIELAYSTPPNTRIKTWGIPREDGKYVVCVGPMAEVPYDEFITNIKTFLSGAGEVHFQPDIKISVRDFCCCVEYFLTNDDLRNNDPRLDLLAYVKSSDFFFPKNDPRNDLITRLKGATVGTGHGLTVFSKEPGRSVELKIDRPGIKLGSVPKKKKKKKS